MSRLNPATAEELLDRLCDLVPRNAVEQLIRESVGAERVGEIKNQGLWESQVRSAIRILVVTWVEILIEARLEGGTNLIIRLNDQLLPGTGNGLKEIADQISGLPSEEAVLHLFEVFVVRVKETIDGQLEAGLLVHFDLGYEVRIRRDGEGYYLAPCSALSS